MRTHHDVAIDENKKIYAVMREDDLVFWHMIPVPIVNDGVIVLSPDGKVDEKVLFYNLIKERLHLGCIIKIYWEILKPVPLMKIFY